MYVLDTNTLVYFFRGEGQVAERLLAAPPTEIAVPSVVVHELETGIDPLQEGRSPPPISAVAFNG